MPERIKVGMILQPQAAHWTGYMDILSRLDEVISVVVADETGKTFEPAKQRIGTKLGGLYRNTREMIKQEHPELEKDCLEWYGTPLKEASARKQTTAYAAERDGYHNFVRSAVRAAAGLAPPPIKSEEGLHVLKTIFAAYRAAATGRVQKVD